MVNNPSQLKKWLLSHGYEEDTSEGNGVKHTSYTKYREPGIILTICRTECEDKKGSSHNAYSIAYESQLDLDEEYDHSYKLYTWPRSNAKIRATDVLFIIEHEIKAWNKAISRDMRERSRAMLRKSVDFDKLIKLKPQHLIED